MLKTNDSVILTLFILFLIKWLGLVCRHRFIWNPDEGWGLLSSAGWQPLSCLCQTTVTTVKAGCTRWSYVYMHVKMQVSERHLAPSRNNVDAWHYLLTRGTCRSHEKVRVLKTLKPSRIWIELATTVQLIVYVRLIKTLVISYLILCYQMDS
jgi:hypothetical protein